jgi:hypothetical protein
MMGRGPTTRLPSEGCIRLARASTVGHGSVAVSDPGSRDVGRTKRG